MLHCEPGTKLHIRMVYKTWMHSGFLECAPQAHGVLVVEHSHDPNYHACAPQAHGVLDYISEQLQDPTFRSEWDAQRPAFQVARFWCYTTAMLEGATDLLRFFRQALMVWIDR